MNQHLIEVSVLDNLGAEVGTGDGAEVLLVGLAVAVVLVQHVWISCLRLRRQNLEPQ